MRKMSVEGMLLPILVQLIVIIAVARIAATLFRRLGQPSAVGEIIAGLLLGPSLLGWLSPELFASIFRPTLESVPSEVSSVVFAKIFGVLAELGLILMLFLIGLEFHFDHLRKCGPAAVAISLTGSLFPFVLGVGLGFLIFGRMEPHPDRGPINELGFALFLGVAFSITAIPVLGRIMMELNIQRTRIGTLTLTAAAVDDAIGWILLAGVAGVVRSSFDPMRMVEMVAETIAFVLVMVFVVRPLMVAWIRRTVKEGTLSVNALTIVLVMLFASAMATNAIGIFAIFGAFFLGAILSDQEEFRVAISARLQDVVVAFFLPVFFTYTGLRTQIGTLGSWEMGLIAVAVVATAMLGKLGGCAVMARLFGFSKKDATIIGVLMNTRGLTELIVINAGYELGVIPPSMFTMLVLMAVLTTILTTPLVVRLRHGTEVEAPMEESSFLRQRGIRKSGTEPGTEPLTASANASIKSGSQQ